MMRIAQQLDLRAWRHPVQSRETAAVGEDKLASVGANLGREEVVQHRAGALDAADHIPLWASGGIPKQQLSIEVDPFPIHCGDHAGKRWRAKARHLYGSCRSLAELDPAVHPDATR